MEIKKKTAILGGGDGLYISIYQKLCATRYYLFSETSSHVTVPRKVHQKNVLGIKADLSQVLVEQFLEHDNHGYLQGKAQLIECQGGYEPTACFLST